MAVSFSTIFNQFRIRFTDAIIVTCLRFSMGKDGGIVISGFALPGVPQSDGTEFLNRWSATSAGSPAEPKCVYLLGNCR